MRYVLLDVNRRDKSNIVPACRTSQATGLSTRYGCVKNYRSEKPAVPPQMRILSWPSDRSYGLIVNLNIDKIVRRISIADILGHSLGRRDIGNYHMGSAVHRCRYGNTVGLQRLANIARHFAPNVFTPSAVSTERRGWRAREWSSAGCTM